MPPFWGGLIEKRLLVTARDDGFRNYGTNREHHDAYDAKRLRLLSRIIINPCGEQNYFLVKQQEVCKKPNKIGFKVVLT